MDLTYSLEDVVRTSDESAVRRRFAGRNLVALFIVLLTSTFVAFMEIATNTATNGLDEVLIAGTNFILALAGLTVVRDALRTRKPGQKGWWRAGEWVRSHTTVSVLTFLALQYPFFLAFTRDKSNWIAWGIFFPLFILPFRMLTTELVLVHLYLIGGAFLMPLVGFAPPRTPDSVGVHMSIAVVNAICLLIEIYASRRLRRQVTSEWTERRDQAREQLRMRDELQYARELQLSMLPERAPRLDWIDLAGVSLPATEVGGDYYDYFVEGGRVAVVCGDVAGHGMASGLVLSALRSGFTLLRDSLTDPAGVLRRLHDLVTETSRRRMLVTVTVVLFEREEQRATLASAGHPPVLVRRADGSVELIELYGPPLGVKLPMTFPQTTLPFASGDVYVLHSDGIYECRNEQDEMYGFDRLIDVVRTHPKTATADSLRDAIIGDVERFRGKAAQADDVTVVVAKVGAR
ncbi:MAG TPA: PP2C family protein-serine/threonine phosphatase [Thermoanaerobaculia bacterium]|jgi:serine phosphatase RsbU (regulator of sigma subunit)